MSRSILSWWCAVALASLFSTTSPGCVEPTPGAVVQDEDRSAIVSGTREREEDAVVYLLNWFGGACTASVIAPRVVLTAKHCVIDIEGTGADLPVWAFTVNVGPDVNSFVDDYTVNEVRRTSFSTLSNSDIAVVILNRDFEHGFKRWAFTPWPGVEPDATITAIGYGQTAYDNPRTAGAKYRRDGHIEILGPNATYELGENELMTQDENTCQGDSGGPILFDDTVVGIVSRGEEGCTGLGWVTRVSSFADMVIEALEDTGACVPVSFEVCNGVDDDCWGGIDDGLEGLCGCEGGAEPQDEVCDGVDNDCNELIDDLDDCACTDGAEPEEEVCDGVDNDCDGEIDEVCQRLGEPCSQDDDCSSGMCQEIDGVEVCTAHCDATEPCPDGGYCDGPPCGEGLCREGRGEARIGSACSAAAECETGFCASISGGDAQCARPCVQDAADCFVTEVCQSIDGECGVCGVRSEDQTSGLGYGEPCLDDDECRSGMCFVDGDEAACGAGCTYRYCAAPCDEDDNCPDAAHCRDGVCVRGPESDEGQICVADDDCEDGQCVDHDGLWRCATDCGEERSCDEGEVCADDTFCWPEGVVPGAACDVEGEECGDGVCTAIADQLVCAERCEGAADCPSGLSCVAIGRGVRGVCIPSSIAVVTEDDDPGGDCECSAAGAPRAANLLWVVALAALALWRRLKNRTPGYDTSRSNVP